ncbi:PspC domain-containing protein [Daejeonella oryzae]|uniref:PspC domain-containing protein n=1 Tax=Daejeonella oryzae TaxID=1122943 RepID=UPI00040BFA46|nr:PspC domain-containing protein [Daejeonella oryzae]
MEKKLYRDQNSKRIAGVCSGLADYLDVDVTLVRIVFLFAAVATLTGFLAYIILWIAVPAKPVNFNSDYCHYKQSQFSRHEY